MNWREHISVDPHRCHGQPCFTGTRIMVSVILDCLAAEMPMDAILAEYPTVSKTAILAALSYSSELSQERIVAA